MNFNLVFGSTHHPYSMSNLKMSKPTCSLMNTT